MGAPWTGATPGCAGLAGPHGLFGGQAAPENTRRSVGLDLLGPAGNRFGEPSPRLLSAGTEPVAVGLPPDAVMEIAAGRRSR